MNPPRLIRFEAPPDANAHGALAPLSVRGLTVAYDEKPALWDVDFEIS